MSQGPYGQKIESSEEFLTSRRTQIGRMAGDDSLITQAIDLQVAASKYGYGYQQLWCGVPIIRLPDDILLIQEIIFETKPMCIIETGVARAGSLLLNASLMEISGLQPAVLGIDIQILPHAREAIQNSRYSHSIEVIETDSSSAESVTAVGEFIRKHSRGGSVLLVLDSNHTHAHVLSELNSLTPSLPIGSVVVVADTVIETMPSAMYDDRPWGKGNNPLSAVNSFLKANGTWTKPAEWNRRGLISEFHDGIIQRLN